MRNHPKAALTGLALSLFVLCAGPAAALAAEPTQVTATEVAQWVVASGDARGLPFAVIDKVAAQVAVFAADGHEIGAAPALVGSAQGDDSVPGIGDRPLSLITPEERTTPAGRFVAAYGPAPGGKTVLWVDYGTAISMHPVVTANREEHRLRRLKSPTPEDNRITYGCINVSAAFYSTVVKPTFTDAGGIVYILPESTPIAEILPAFEPQPVALAASSDEGPGE